MLCRSKRVLGFQRKAGSNQAQLQWQNSAPVYSDDASRDQIAVACESADDAAMAAADNINWDLL